MKQKLLSVLLTFALVFTMVPCSMAFGAAKAPTDAELEKIFDDMAWGLLHVEDPYFGPNEKVDPVVAHNYLYRSGAMDKYFDENTWEYHLSLTQYINLIKANFVNYDKAAMTKWLTAQGYYDAAKGSQVNISPEYWYGGDWGWETLAVRTNGADYQVDGLFFWGSEDTGDVLPTDEEFYSYWNYVDKGIDGMGNPYEYTYKMAIDASINVKIMKTDAGLKIAAFEKEPSYTYKGKTYYQNSKTGKFDQNFSFSLSSNRLVYTGKALTKPTVVVKNKEGKKLVKGTDYSLSWSKSTVKDVGKYSVTVNMKAPYGGTKKFDFIVLPKAPTSATADLYGHNDVKFSWSKSTGASGYAVYYKLSSAQNYKLFKRTTATSVKVADLANGKNYMFKVVPYYKKGDERWDSTKFKTDSVYTLKQLNKPVATRSQLKVKLSWKDIEGESGYQVYKAKKKNGKYVKVSTHTTKNKSILISATKGNTYYYRVRPFKTVGKEKVYGPWSVYTQFKR